MENYLGHQPSVRSRKESLLVKKNIENCTLLFIIGLEEVGSD